MKSFDDIAKSQIAGQMDPSQCSLFMGNGSSGNGLLPDDWSEHVPSEWQRAGQQPMT